MKVLDKITYRSLKLNKKRSIGTIIGIVLAVALICAVGGLATSYLKSLVNNAIEERGYQHIELVNVNSDKLAELKQNRDIERINTIGNNGRYLGKDCKAIYSYSMENNQYDELKFELLEGRFPENENEIVVNTDFLLEDGYKLGDTVDLYTYDEEKDITFIDISEENNRTSNEINNEVAVESLTIVGVVSKSRWGENYEHRYVIEKGTGSESFNAFITLKDVKDYKGTLSGIMEVGSYKEINEDDPISGQPICRINHELLKWEALSFSDSSTQMLIALVIIVMFIVLVVSVFCIRNSFEISITEKLRIYGMFASVGTTKKQIKKNVIYEGVLLGLIGIPLGILGGCAAVTLLIFITNEVGVSTAMFEHTVLVAHFTWHPIVTSIILGIITIYLSAISAARRASKVSPIENIKNTNEVKITKKNLKMPKYIKSIFKMGGVIAYKNLKRSKKKYRTTVLALVISVFSFISVNAFLEEGLMKELTTVVDSPYKVHISTGVRELNSEVEDYIKNMKEVDEVHSCYKMDTNESIMVTDEEKVHQLLKDEYFVNNTDVKGCEIDLIALDDKEFNEYIKEIGIKSDIEKTGAIFCDGFGNLKNYYDNSYTSGREEWVLKEKDRAFSYNKGDIIKTFVYAGETKIDVEYNIAKVTDKLPKAIDIFHSSPLGYIIVNKDGYTDFNWVYKNIAIKTKDSYKVEKVLRGAFPHIGIDNMDKQIQSAKGIAIIYNVFLYGFIGVITLIGLTNIFNTITSNMELRQKEFAMLKSVGMTKNEFNRMIRLETVFYSTKALVYGIVLGILGAFVIHKAFGFRENSVFIIPYKAIVVSIIFVVIIVYGVMKYSINKIDKKNVIETIRNENI